jgi:hypothetical protein
MAIAKAEPKPTPDDTVDTIPPFIIINIYGFEDMPPTIATPLPLLLLRVLPQLNPSYATHNDGGIIQ